MLPLPSTSKWRKSCKMLPSKEVSLEAATSPAIYCSHCLVLQFARGHYLHQEAEQAETANASTTINVEMAKELQDVAVKGSVFGSSNFPSNIIVPTVLCFSLQGATIYIKKLSKQR